MLRIAHKPEIGNVVVNADDLIRFYREIIREIEAGKTDEAKSNLEKAIRSFDKYD
jgi:outer membrane protein assembly factor BamD (BamD/ComL family)